MSAQLMSEQSNQLLLDEPELRPCREKQVPRALTVRHARLPQPVPDWLHRGQIPGLDGLRAIAITLVVLLHCHATPGLPQSKILGKIAVNGHFGVDIFFIISGFLITTLLAREIERTGHLDLKRFFTRRCLRIMPEYLVLLVSVAICQGFGKVQLSSQDWFGAITYTTNFFYHPSWELRHSWSLAVEEHFYLLWPLALVAGGVSGGWRFATTCVVVCWLARCVVAFVVPFFCTPADALCYAGMAECWTFTRLDTISLGCLLGLSCRIDSWRTWLDRLTHPILLIIYVSVICVSLDVLSDNTKYHLCVEYTLNGICMTLLVWGLIRSKGIVRYLLNHRIVRAIGVMSYSIYLWQQLFIHPFRSSWIHEYPQNLVFTIAAATLSFNLIEYPFKRLKNFVAN